MDREKVIKALQNCSVQNDVGCQGCPYFEERETYGHEWCTTSMAQDALALLKEQEEKIEQPTGLLTDSAGTLCMLSDARIADTATN